MAAQEVRGCVSCRLIVPTHLDRCPMCSQSVTSMSQALSPPKVIEEPWQRADQSKLAQTESAHQSSAYGNDRHQPYTSGASGSAGKPSSLYDRDHPAHAAEREQPAQGPQDEANAPGHLLMRGYLAAMSAEDGKPKQRLWYVLHRDSLTFYNSAGGPGEPLKKWLGWMPTDCIYGVSRAAHGIKFSTMVINLPNGKAKGNREMWLLGRTRDEESAWFMQLYNVTDGKRGMLTDMVGRCKAAEEEVLSLREQLADAHATIQELQADVMSQNVRLRGLRGLNPDQVQELEEELIQLRRDRSAMHREAMIMSKRSNAVMAERDEAIGRLHLVEKELRQLRNQGNRPVVTVVQAPTTKLESWV